MVLIPTKIFIPIRASGWAGYTHSRYKGTTKKGIVQIFTQKKHKFLHFAGKMSDFRDISRQKRGTKDPDFVKRK